MMKVDQVPISQAQKNIGEVAESDNITILTKRGVAVAAVVPFDKFEEMYETGFYIKEVGKCEKAA